MSTSVSVILASDECGGSPHGSQFILSQAHSAGLAHGSRRLPGLLCPSALLLGMIANT